MVGMGEGGRLRRTERRDRAVPSPKLLLHFPELLGKVESGLGNTSRP